MKTEYRGGPVAGGTYPTEIWHDFMTSFITVRDRRDAERGTEREPEEAPSRALHRRARRCPSRSSRPRRRRTQDAPEADAPQAPQRTSGPAPALGSRPAAAAGTAAARPAPHPGTRAPAAAPRLRRRRPEPRRRDAVAVRVAETPRQLDRLGDADPLARPPARGGRPSRGRISTGPSSALPFRPRPIPSAWVSLPGPLQSSRGRSRPRRAAIRSRPSSGSSARISTAAPMPSASQTALSSEWMP